MESEHDSKKSIPIPDYAKDSPSEKKDDTLIVEYSDHPSFNFGMALAWLVTLLAVLAGLFFWWMNRDTETALADKKAERDAIVQQINSPTYADIETKASEFKDAVNALGNATKEKFSVTDFLTDLYGKITNDVTLQSIVMADDGVVSLAGSTGSYRAVADLMMALESMPALSEIELDSVSQQQVEEGGSFQTVFSISAKVDKTKYPAKKIEAVSETTAAPQVSPSPQSLSGGENVQIQ